MDIISNIEMRSALSNGFASFEETNSGVISMINSSTSILVELRHITVHSSFDIRANINWVSRIWLLFSLMDRHFVMNMRRLKIGLSIVFTSQIS